MKQVWPFYAYYMASDTAYILTLQRNERSHMEGGPDPAEGAKEFG